MSKRNIKHSPEKAVALRYQAHRDMAPKVTAKGSGLVAQKIIELGRQYGIPIQKDPALIQVLAQLDFYQEIPSKIFAVVAEILAFVYRLNREAPRAPDESG